MDPTLNPDVYYNRSSVPMQSMANTSGYASNRRPINAFSGQIPSHVGPQRPRMYYRPHNQFLANSHSAKCCLSTEHRRGCRLTDPQICAICGQPKAESDSSDAFRSQSGDIPDNCMANDRPMTNGSDPMNGIDHSLNQMSDKWIKRGINLFETIERQMITGIDRYWADLESMAQYVEQVLNRFARNQSICGQLNAVMGRINWAKAKAEEERNRIKAEISAQKQMITEDVDRYEIPVFDPKSLPELPNLLAFLKELIDMISMHVFDQSIGSENCAKNLIKSGDSLTENVVNNDSNVDSIPEEIAVNNEQNISAKSDDMSTKESIIGQTFGSDVFPVIPLPFSRSLYSVIPLPFVEEKHSNERVDRLANYYPMEPKLTVETNGKSSTDQSMEKLDSVDSKPNANSSSNESKAKPTVQLSQAQRKLLDRLKGMYTEWSDDLLVEAMIETKNSIVRSGLSKGFTGMKMNAIVSKIVEYIDNNIVLTVNSDTPEDDMHSVDDKTTVAANCSLCGHPFGPHKEKMPLSCGHVFHLDCLQNWAQTNNRCPDCADSADRF